MPLTKLEFRPGIIREVTQYSNSGGWYDGDKVRFRQGYPEKMGGWLRVVQDKLTGTCRYLHQWSSVESDRYVGLGTSSHLDILWSENFYDITPIRATIAAGANPFETGAAGTTTMLVNIPGNNASAGDYVTFSGATAFDAYTAAQLNSQFEVVAVSGAQITITMPVPSIATNATGGGSAVKAAFLIPPGLDDAQIGQGWGVPPWGGSAPGAGMSSGWGEPFNPALLNPVDPTVNQLRLWDLDNFGEDLVANIRGGPIYYWHQSDGLGKPAVPLTQAYTNSGNVTFTPNQVPQTASQVIVSPNDRHLIAYGCPDVYDTVPNLMLVRWSDAEDAYNWEPLRTNSAGSQPLSGGSYIICAMRTAGVILIWTDLGLWTQTYIGMPYVYGFQSIAEGLSIIGPNACINTGSIVLWMDRGIFYAYTGQVQELPCAVKDYVFNDFNYLQAYKVYAGHNHAFSEVIWFYPSASSLENDSYVVYNYGEQTWSIGKLQRTAWLDMGRANYPIATDRDNSLLYYHEYGDDADGQPLTGWIESADVDADGGDHYLFMGRLIPDVLFRGTAQQQQIGLTILTRPTPGAPKQPAARLTITPNTGQQYVRLRERQISFRFESDALGVSWRLGTLRTDLQPDGRR